MPPQNQQLLNEVMIAVVPWAEGNRALALAHGRELAPDEKAFATKIGILRPDLVRVLIVDRMPTAPANIEHLSREFLDVELAAGLTLGYGILVTKGHEKPSLIRHELGHVLQVERIGDMLKFLALYFEQVLHYGYENAPFEREAENYENEFIR
jgi:hypothetical protein